MRLLIAVLCCLITTAQAVEVRAEHSNDIICGDRLQWRIDGAPATWYQADVTRCPQVRVWREDGEEAWNIPSFLDQAHRWVDDEAKPSGRPLLRWRFCPLEAGTYRWQMLDPSREAVIADGSFVVAATDLPYGPIQRHPANPLLLADQRNEAMIAIGPNICWANTPDRIGRMRSYLDALQAVGGTHFRLWCASWMGQVGDQERADAIRLDQAELLDRVLAMAYERGLYVTLVLDNHHDVHKGFNGPYGASVMERFNAFFGLPLHPAYRFRLRYVMARYAAYHNILAWEMMNEMDEAIRMEGYTIPYQQRVSRCRAWLQAAVAAVRQLDPYGHLVTSSCAYTDDSSLILAEELDLIQVHQYVPPMQRVEAQHVDGIPMLAAHLEQVQSGKRPYCFAEVGFQGSNEHNSGHNRDPGGVLLQQLAWAGLLLGGYGNGMNWWWDVYIHESQLWDVYRPLALAVDAIDWNDPNLVPMGLRPGKSLRILGWSSPRQALVWIHLNDNTWLRQSMPDGGTSAYDGQYVVIDGLLPERSFSVRWIDPSTGDSRDGAALQSNADGRTLVQLGKGQPEGVVILQLQDQP